MWKERKVFTALPLALVWTILPAACLGLAGGGVLYGLLAFCDAVSRGDFKYYFFGVTCLWVLFALLDGVPARLLNRFRIGQPLVQAVAEGWLCKDRKAFSFGPYWWRGPNGAGDDEFRRRYYYKYGSNNK